MKAENPRNTTSGCSHQASGRVVSPKLRRFGRVSAYAIMSVTLITSCLDVNAGDESISAATGWCAGPLSPNLGRGPFVQTAFAGAESGEAEPFQGFTDEVKGAGYDDIRIVFTGIYGFS